MEYTFTSCRDNKIANNIQIAIDKWKKDQPEPIPPETVNLDKYEDFDCHEHNDYLLSFPINDDTIIDRDTYDKMYELQNSHNSCVTNKYNRYINKLKNAPNWAAETYIIFDMNDIMSIDFIKFEINGFIIDKWYSTLIFMCVELYDITPLTYSSKKPKHDNMLFFNFYKDIENLKRTIVYTDGTSKILSKDMIHMLRY